jgi:hypothetical protein
MFPEYFQSQIGKSFREAFRPCEIEIPGLYDGSMSQLARSGQLPSQAVANPIIPILDRTRINSWAVKVHQQLQGVILL